MTKDDINIMLFKKQIQQFMILKNTSSKGLVTDTAP